MSCSLSFPPAHALPSIFPSKTRLPSLSIINSSKPQHPNGLCKNHGLHNSFLLKIQSLNPINHSYLSSLLYKKFLPAVEIGAVLAAIEQPALAVTGVNNEPDLKWTLAGVGIIAFFYLLIMPPILLTWLKLRWHKRKLLEMYLQFMFVFIFFPGLLLWAPFVNVRQLPRDPNMKYPWSIPQEPPLTDSTSK